MPALFAAGVLAAQTVNQFTGETNLINMQQFMQIDANYRAGQQAASNVQGSPRLFNTWLPAKVSVRGKNKTVENIRIDLDQELQLLLIHLDDSKGPGVVNPELVDTIVVQTTGGQRIFRPFVPAAVGDNAPGKERFYEILYDGKFQMLKAFTKTFRKAENRDAYSRDQTTDQYIDESYYLLRTPGGSYQRINKLKQKNLEKDLPRYQSAIGRVTEKEKLDLSRESDVVRLFQLLDQ